MKEPVFPPEYFYDEVREGFFVSEMMKRFWAAQLTILYEIVKICDRHSIPWYADMGTLLGAIRHKGFVPWDDDIDISMNRDDWEKFFEYAPNELPEGYRVLSVWTDEEYGLSVGRITGSDCINTNREYMERFGGCPYCAGVDVYPIDRLYKNPEKEQKRKSRGKAIKRAYDLIVSQGINAEETRKALADIERDNHVILHRKGNIGKELILLFENTCMECRDEDYEQVALMYTWIIGDWANCPRELYEERIEVPFENTTLMGTAKYDELLTIYYHDYMKIKKGGGVHEYPLYKDQEQMLKDNFGHNPYRYTFARENLSIIRREATFEKKCREILGLMKDCVGRSRILAGQGDHDNTYRLLSGCQDISITLGTLLENKYGENCLVIKELEDYCELLYQTTQQWDSLFDEKLDRAADSINSKLDELFNDSVKEIVFLPCRQIWWNTMKPLYEEVLDRNDINVRIIPLPYFDRNPYGEIGERHDESAYFASLKGYIPESDYDIEKKHPDIIVMQVPFDGSSCAMTVPPKYYSDNMLKCCDELWYIPCFAPDPPESENDKATVAISVLIEQPAVINADKIMIDNNDMRSFYIESLVNMCGEDTREYWENKIESDLRIDKI